MSSPDDAKSPVSLAAVPSLPQRVADMLRQEIGGTLQPGERLPAMRSLAKRFSVSINTIGAALDILASDGLVEKRQGSGVYVLERSSRMRIGILSELDLLDPRLGHYFRLVANNLRQLLAQRDWDVQLYVGQAEPGLSQDLVTCPAFWEDVEAGRLDGAVILDVPSSEKWYWRVYSATLPMVGHHTQDVVEIDFDDLVTRGVASLAAQGCSRLGMIGWCDDATFRAAVAAAGLQTQPSWIRTDLQPGIRGAGWEEFREIWLAGDGRPDGLLVLDDTLFDDAQFAMLELGVKIPQELQVLVQLTRGAWPMTRLPVIPAELDPQEVASAMAELLVRRLAEPKAPGREVRVRCEIADAPISHGAAPTYSLQVDAL